MATGPDPLFDSLSSQPRLHALARLGVIRRYRRGTVLIDEGDAGDTLLILLAGRLRIYATDATGREVVFGICTAGDYVGEMSLDGGPRCATVATMDPSIVSVVNRLTVKQYIASEPEFAFDLLARVIRRARLATESTRNMALMNVYGRVAHMLESSAVIDDDGTRFVPDRLTHREIAGRVGASREMISRIMKDLSDGGYVQSHRDRIVLQRRLPAEW